jgi:hypothetical protein
MTPPSAETIPYEEVQELPWPFMALGLGGTVGGIAAARALSMAMRLSIAGVAVTGLGVAVTEFLVPLRVTLLPAELQIRFGRRTRFRIPLRHIARAYARRYHPLKEYGGWGIRNGREGRAFTLGGRDGVQLVLRSGTRVLIGSRQAEELASAIRRITGCMGDPDTDSAAPMTVQMEVEVVEVIEVTEVVEVLEESADVADTDAAEPAEATASEDGIDADPDERYEV